MTQKVEPEDSNKESSQTVVVTDEVIEAAAVVIAADWLKQQLEGDGGG